MVTIESLFSGSIGFFSVPFVCAPACVGREDTGFSAVVAVIMDN